MFSIRNSANNVTQIDIIGDIGQDWWTEEGHTLNSVREQIQEITGNIEVNIASLGGSLIDALAIHDMLKTHQGQVVSNIIGATASSGFVIAMAGDEVVIAENALLLTHRASSGRWGTAEDMRDEADNLETFESRIVNISMKRSAKKKKSQDDIKALMNEERWITAEEAMNEWGFVDSIYKPTKILNSADISKLSSIKPLPQNFNNKMENTDKIVDNVLAKLGLQKISNEVSVESLKAEIASLKAENANLKQVDNSAEVSRLTSEITNKVTEFDALKVQFDALVIENNATKAELAKLQGTPTPTGGSDPIDPQNEVEEVKPLRFQPTNEAVANVLNAAKVRETIKF